MPPERIIDTLATVAVGGALGAVEDLLTPRLLPTHPSAHLGRPMGRARRARRIAQTAAYGGGFGVAGIGVLGILGYGVVKAEKAVAHLMVGKPLEKAPDDAGTYGAGFGEPLAILVLGDSLAAGLGTDSRVQTVGAIVASGVSAFAARPVRLTNVAVVGSVSADLGVQVANALDEVVAPDLAVILIGANDITHRVDKAVAVRHLTEAVTRLLDAGAEVVVGTCPDLGTVQPIAQPLRSLVRRWSRDLAAAQTVGVVEAGGRTVSLGDLIGPDFERMPSVMFSADRFHPSPAGYARAASALLPTIGAALGLLPEGLPVAQSGSLRPRREEVRPVSRAATAAVLEPGTEVSPTQIAGQTRGPLGRWAVVLHRAGLGPAPAPVPQPQPPDHAELPDHAEPHESTIEPQPER